MRQQITHLYLVGGYNPLKNMKVSWDDDIPNMENHPNGSKPPTRLLIWLMIDNNEYSMVRALWWYICSTGFIDSIYIYIYG